MLVVIQYLHLRKLIHHDFNQPNLLINSDSTVKFCDFGLAENDSEVKVGEQVMPEYVLTKWYRAPELIIYFNYYNPNVNLLAIGCIVNGFSLANHYLSVSFTID
jgi:serine/threonine protein kinase